MRTVYLIKDREEKFKAKYNRSYFVNTYRLVDESGKDVVYPWFTSKKLAKGYAKMREWTLIDNTK